MGIKQKLGLVLFISLALVGAFGYYLVSLNEMILEKRQRFALSYNQIISLSNLKEALRGFAVEGTQMVFTEGEPDEYEFFKTRIHSILDEIEKGMESELRFIGDGNEEKTEHEEEEEEQKVLEQLKSDVLAFIAKADAITSQIKKPVSKEVIEKFDELMEGPFEKQLLSLIDLVMEDEREELKAIEAAALSLAKDARFWTLVEVALISILFLLILGFVSRCLIRPILSMQTASRKIMNDEFDISIDVDSGDEVGQLSRAFRDMARRIHGDLSEIKTHLAAIVEHSNDAIIGKDLDGTILSWNRGAEKMYGYNEPDIVGKSITTLVPPSRDGEIQTILNQIRNDLPIQNYETQRIKWDGTLIEVSLNISPIKNEDGKIIGASTLARDITQLKKAQEKLVEARNEAEKASQAKTEFLARMSHELRTPMNAILGFAQLMELEPDALTDGQKENLRHIREGGDHLMELINEILDLSRIESGKLTLEMKKMDLLAVVENIVTLSTPLASERDIQITSETVNESNIWVQGDLLRMKQVVMNLVSNAIKYNKPAGEIEITFDFPSDRVRLNIKDTGRGIARDQAERLFKPFERMEGDQDVIEGTGIGLAISKQLVEQMGGEIGLESAVGVGSTFYIEFPLSEVPETSLQEN